MMPLAEICVSAEQLLSELRRLDIRLVVEGDRLRCSAPRGQLTTELEMAIAAHKPELMRVLGGSPPNGAGRLPRARAGEVPLSFAQERFWFLQSLDPESTAYSITAVRRTREAVDEVILRAALRALVERHEILRTNFPEVDGAPIQTVHDRIEPELAVLDIGPVRPAETGAAVDALIQEQAKRGFDLARDPLLRLALIRTGGAEQAIVLTVHHIICDAWSIGILFAELAALYSDRFYGRSSPAKSSLQYRDYAAWERSRQRSGDWSGQLDYWKEKLRDAPRLLDLPLDHPRPAAAKYQGRLQRFQLDARSSEALMALGRKEGATPFMVLLTVFKALLFRYTQQTDIVVGTPVTTRTHVELENLIGCLINTHVLRTEFGPDVTTRELLARVRTTVIESLANADVPFETLVSELVTERDLSRSPLFQAAFILQNTPMAADYDIVCGGTTFDITLYMWEANGAIGGSVEYNAQLFEPETMAGFGGCFETLAEAMAAQPDLAIYRLPVIAPEQENAWFVGQQGPRRELADLTTCEWIERQAAASPDKVAAVCGQEQLTFRELSLRSNRLARRLQSLGVGRESLVALCLDRSTDLVVAPLAVWKAGGAYVPLDPEYPTPRLAFMLEDSRASVLVTESRLLDRLPSQGPHILCLDRERALIEDQSAEPLPPAATGENLAYVIYTSGSTGKPKGVEIRHRSLANLLASMQEQPGIAASDRLLAVTTLSFDIAGLELYLPLIAGAEVVIAPRAAAFDGSALAAILNNSGITIMQATPVTWRLLLDAGWHGIPGLKILCGGEALPQELAEQLLATGAALWNMYGPTETTIWSTLEQVRPGTQVSIGRPIANTQLYILDEYGEPVPPGVAGELYIGGDGLARGYLGRPELTAGRFVESTHYRARLYRTGDMVRRLADGRVAYMGRADHQVKLRGFRIELGEIEAAIERRDDIAQAVVVVREDEPGDRRLVAYVRTAERRMPEARTLRRDLRTHLPEYMIPAAFVQVEAFPLTPNHKVDRKALLGTDYQPQRRAEAAGHHNGHAHAEEPSLAMARNRFEPPSNHIEFVMAEIWRDVLGVDEVSVLDNFFELGGHSLSAARLIARVRSALGMELPLRCIFIDPTIAGLARHISWDVATRGYRYTSELPKWNCLVPAQPRGTRPPFFFVAGYFSPDDTLLELSRLIPHMGMDQPVFGFRPRWLEDGGQEYANVEEMARQFVTELRTVQPHGPYLLGGHCVGGIAALEMAQLLQQEGEEVKLMVLLDTERSSTRRSFLLDLHYVQVRLNHMAEVIGEFRKSGNRQRRELIRSLARRKLGVAPPAEAHEDRIYQLKVHHRRLLSSHTTKPYEGRITLIVNEEQARAEKDLGWKGMARQGLDIHIIPGDHHFILMRHGKEIADVIMAGIDAAWGTHDRPGDYLEARAG